MSARHPTPWRAKGRDNGRRGRQRREYWDVLDRNEFFVAEGLDETTAREICAAVNDLDRLREDLAAALDHANECSRRAAAERAGRARAVEEAQRDANMEADRLRDIVRRLLPLASERLATMAAGDWDLLREARAAIGEAGR